MYQDVRGPDRRLLFRFDPERLLVEIVAKGKPYLVDLTAYMDETAAIVEIEPYTGLTPPGRLR